MLRAPFVWLSPWQVMFLQRKDQVIMTIELLDTEETQMEDPVEVQVILSPPPPPPALGPSPTRVPSWDSSHSGLRRVGEQSRDLSDRAECDPLVSVLRFSSTWLITWSSTWAWRGLPAAKAKASS